MLLVEGVTWKGVFFKHFHVHPIYLLVISIVSGVVTFINVKRGNKTTEGYRKTVCLIFKITPWFFVFYILAILLQPSVSDWLIKKGILRWNWLKDTLGNISILLIAFLVINIDSLSRLGILRKINKGYHLMVLGKKSVKISPLVFKITLIIIFSIILIFYFDVFTFATIIIAVLSSLALVLLNDLLVN